MGLYDRDYYREERSGLALRPPQTAVGTIVVANVAIYLLMVLLSGAEDRDPITTWFALRPENLLQPWLWWRMVSYGFVHSHDPLHVLSNMLALWFLGRDVEATYGKREFWRIYLAALAVGGLAWSAIELFALRQAGSPVVGASGAVTAVVVLFAQLFPRRTLLLFFVFPVPAWIVGVFFVLTDLWSSFAPQAGPPVAYSVHLAGAALALLYYQLHWNFGRMVDFQVLRRVFRPRPWLRVHNPPTDEGADAATDADLSEQVDRILEKISTQGESSLTRKERRLLESASREYQRRRRMRS